ncbi:MAG: hypothetical protein AcusKO_25020 [Acuticoccus sp.]
MKGEGDTTMDAPRSVKYYGTEEPVAPPRILRVGALEVRLDGGNLRYIRIGGVEALRAIAFLARDRNWGTYGATIENLEVEESEDAFRVSYRARCGDSERLVYDALIEGRADGSLTFSAEGMPETDFVTNRTGFTVLHPLAGVVDAPVTVEHTDGRIVESRFPVEINPACPFHDIRALTHEIMPGVSVTCRMEGDAFEMEDHRNWLDASFKTYVRPLAEPWPYTLNKGEGFTQKVTLTVNGTARAGATGAALPVTVRVGAPTGGVVPRLGLAVPAEEAKAALAHAALLRKAQPSFLVCHFDPAAGHDSSTVADYKALGEAVGAPLFLEAVIPCLDIDGKPTDNIDVLHRDIGLIAAHTGAVTWERVAVSPASDLKCTLPGSVFPPAPSWPLLIEATRNAFPGLPVGGGMFSYFTELNRKRPPRGLLDFVCHSGAPIVHAGDDESVTETLEALPSVFASVRAFMDDTPYYVFPTAVAMRMNPYGAAPAENPGNIRQAMNRDDPRERGLLGAAWYAGYFAHAVRGRLDAVTLAAVSGPSGIVVNKQDGAYPWFGEAGATVRPSWHAIATAADLAGRPTLLSESDWPRGVQAFAAVAEDGPRLVCVNLTDRPVTLAIEGAMPVAARMLDENSFAAACRDPDGLTWSDVTGNGGALAPFAIAEFRLKG